MIKQIKIKPAKWKSWKVGKDIACHELSTDADISLKLTLMKAIEGNSTRVYSMIRVGAYEIYSDDTATETKITPKDVSKLKEALEIKAMDILEKLKEVIFDAK